MNVRVTPEGDAVCDHGTAVDVHCCNCHSGFLFDADACVCGEYGMDTRTGDIYNTLDEAKAAGVPDEHLVTGPRPALERLSAMIKEHGSFKSYPPNTGAHGTEHRYCGNSGCVDCADWQSWHPMQP
jgi:hypothetical protein